MIFVQGLFRKCKTKKNLNDICLHYAQSNTDEVFYFEETIKRKGKENVCLIDIR